MITLDLGRWLPAALASAIAACASTDDVTATLQAAIDRLAARGGGMLRVPAGRYHLKGLRLKSRVSLVGERGAEFVRIQGDAPPRPTHAQYFDQGANRALIEVDWQATLAAPVVGVTIGGIVFRDDVAAIGFREHRHLLNLGGVRDLRVVDCRFEDWCGDAILLATSYESPGEGRRNFGVAIERCAFVARVANQRQAISAIHAQGLKISGCRFEGCTRGGTPGYAQPADDKAYPDFDLMDPAAGPPMPGAIDIEADPGDAGGSRDIAITGNVFERCGGSGGAVSLVTPAGAVPVGEVLIADNVVRDHRGGAIFVVDAGRSFAPGDAGMAVTITRNTAIGGNQSYRLTSCKGVRALGNSYTSLGEPGDIGGWDGRTARDVTIADRLVDCGTRPSRSAIRLFDAAEVSLDGSEFVDCGGTESGPIQFGDGVHQTTSAAVSLRVKMTFPRNRTAAYSVRVLPSHRLAGDDVDAVIAPPTYTNQLRSR